MTKNASTSPAFIRAHHDVNILARTIYGEARGEYRLCGLAPLMAVANVVMNRVRLRTWFGATVGEVCQKPWQFSCWNDNDPNAKVIANLYLCDAVFDVCMEVADKVTSGAWPDLTKGCEHYHRCDMKVLPPWARGVKPVVQIGSHVFYKVMKG